MKAIKQVFWPERFRQVPEQFRWIDRAVVQPYSSIAACRVPPRCTCSGAGCKLSVVVLRSTRCFNETIIAMFIAFMLLLVGLASVALLFRSESGSRGYGAASHAPTETNNFKSAFAIAGPVAHIGPEWMNDE